MSAFRNLLVLVIYVLGAHALPMAHPFLHHHHHHQTQPQRVAVGGAVAKCLLPAAVPCCSGHRHCQTDTAKSTLSMSVAHEHRIAADGDCEHRCGETCALCLAGHSPVGASTTAGPQFEDLLLSGRHSAIESGCLLPGRRGELPEQRGPPVACSIELAAA